ncbi:hypothetical protein DNU06_16050 [Putridiphycobacter roseus]|uniref:Secretion system C-terminal sorting domain-containing protein n=1 Tax=Putridiphycobacter roseus TaxID=2219161 RepID=A0A2W1MWL8_9FLAO|nr:T9SS type A sorting domain-containing protein [Putridiphycobacter roseus]PZE15784.1 hypothetical protein DNU06_16050 [Putridiphycobacter roseus]
MRLISLFYFIFLFAFLCKAQPVLNIRLDVGTAGATIFSSVFATESCYYVIGKSKDLIPPYLQEGVFIKFNLDGSIADTTYYKNDSANYILWESPNLIKTLDGNFAQTFTVAPLASDFHFGFIKLNTNGDTLIFKTYLDLYNQNLDDWVLQPGGFLQDPIDSAYYGTVNVSRYSDLVGGTALFKISKSGELLWHQTYYGISGNFRIFNAASLIKIAPDRLMIGGTQTHTPAANADWRDNTKILIVDTLGNIIQTKVYPADQLAYGCNGLSQTMDGGYIYGGQNGTFVQNGNARDYRARIVKLNANLMEEWRIEQGIETSQNLMNFENILELTDSTFVVVGRSLDTTDINLHGYHTGGWLLKFNLSGAILWSRKYRKVEFLDNENNFPTHILYDVDITPDSGFVMVGQSQNFEASNPEPIGQLGWLVKTDKHGCLVPGCEEFDTAGKPPVKPKSEIGLKIFPNPANDELYIYYASQIAHENVIAYLYNVNGQIVKQWAITSNYTTYMLDVSSFSKGIYVLKIANDLEILKTEKLVLE